MNGGVHIGSHFNKNAYNEMVYYTNCCDTILVNNSKNKSIYIYGMYILTRIVETWTIIIMRINKKRKYLNKITDSIV